MKVKALKDCFVDGGRRRAGVVFDFTPMKKDGKELPLPKYLETVVPAFGAAKPAETAKK